MTEFLSQDISSNIVIILIVIPALVTARTLTSHFLLFRKDADYEAMRLFWSSSLTVSRYWPVNLLIGLAPWTMAIIVDIYTGLAVPPLIWLGLVLSIPAFAIWFGPMRALARQIQHDTDAAGDDLALQARAAQAIERWHRWLSRTCSFATIMAVLPSYFVLMQLYERGLPAD